VANLPGAHWGFVLKPRQVGIKKVYIAGGPMAVSSEAEAETRAIVCPRNPADPNCVQRHAGADRYGTSVAIAAHHFPSATNFVAATGVNWPDSIAAGPFAARRGAPILLSETDNFDEIPSRYMVSKLAPGNRGWVVGGPAAVSAAAEWDFRSVLPK